jgi:hypothetical protein
MAARKPNQADQIIPNGNGAVAAYNVPMPSETLERLSRRFPAAKVKKNPKGQHYVAIDAVIGRFNDVLGTGWKLLSESTQVIPISPEVATYSRNEKAAVAATVTVAIEALGSSRTGVGGDFAALEDIDKVVKTAQAEAFKKAGHQYGVGLYLWQESERLLVDAVQAGNHKGALKLLCEINGLPLDVDAVNEKYGVDSKTDDGKVAILTQEGLL